MTFDHNRDAVKGPFVPTLRDVASVLRDYPKTTIEVWGHSSSLGADDYNLDLSERRGMNVASELIRNGVLRQRVVVTAFGEARPIADNSTESGRALNDRVEIIIGAQQE